MWKVHVERKKLLQSTFLTRSFSWTPHWYSHAGKVLKKEGKENMVTSCVCLRKSTVTLIHCCYNSIIYKLWWNTDCCKQCPQLRVIKSNSSSPYLIYSNKCGEYTVHSAHSTGLYLEFHRTFLLHQLLVLAVETVLSGESPNISWAIVHFHKTESWTITSPANSMIAFFVWKLKYFTSK